jgi:hypothetical protein
VRKRLSFGFALCAAVAVLAATAASCGGRADNAETQSMDASASASVSTDEGTPTPSPSSTPAPNASPSPSPAPETAAAQPPAGAATTGGSAVVDAPAWVLGDAGPMQVSFKLLLYQKEGKDDVVSVQQSQIFNSGDSIRVGATATENGYIYLLHKGSTGRFRILYPDRKIARGSNAVPKGSEVVVPPGAWFTFDKNPGVETIYALYSTQRGSEALRTLQNVVKRSSGSTGAQDDEKSLTDAVNQTAGKDAATRRSLVKVVRLTHQ